MTTKVTDTGIIYPDGSKQTTAAFGSGDGGSVDAYTKAETDEKFYDKEEIDSLIEGASGAIVAHYTNKWASNVARDPLAGNLYLVAGMGFTMKFEDATKLYISDTDGEGTVRDLDQVKKDDKITLTSDNGSGVYTIADISKLTGYRELILSKESATGTIANDTPLTIVLDVASSSGGGTAGSLPQGSIIMWSDPVVPDDWQICDGTNDTPDLRDKFIVGAGTTYALDATGGSKDAVAVSHNHGASTNATGGHTHTININATTSNGSGCYSSNYGGGIPTVASSNAGHHAHTVTVNAAGVSGANKNLPPYYSLYYIMKMVEGGGGSGGGIEEAPEDGKQYARQDGDWTEVEATSGGGGGDVEAQPPVAFSVKLSTTQNVTSGVEEKLNFDTTELDTDNAFDVSENSFVAKKEGIYQFNYGSRSIADPTTMTVHNISLYVNDVLVQRAENTFADNKAWAEYITDSCIKKLNVDDIVCVKIQMNADNPRVDSGIRTNFSGHMISSFGGVSEKEAVVVNAKNAVTQTIPAGAWTHLNSIDTAIADTTNCYKEGKFTPTVAGYYEVSVVFMIATEAGHKIAGIAKNSTTSKYSQGVYITNNGYTVEHTNIVYLNGVDDYVAPMGYTSTGGDTTTNNCWFNAHLITGQSTSGGGEVTPAKAPEVTVLKDGTGTYTTPTGALYLTVEMVGGGGGGSAANSVAITAGVGGTTIFGEASCTGGGGGRVNDGSYAGGVADIASYQGVGLDGGRGGNNGANDGTNTAGNGAPSAFGGGGLGGGGTNKLNGTNGSPNTGAGGGGGGGIGVGAGRYAAGGGSAGAYADFIITTPNKTYDYTVGTGGAGATADTNSGGAGGSGVIIVTAHFGATGSGSGDSGKVLQVVNNTHNIAVSTASTARLDTGLTATITPSSASSKILVLVSQTIYKNIPSTSGAKVWLMRDSTDLFVKSRVGLTDTGTNGNYVNYGANHLDSPNTTSAVTYKTQFANHNVDGIVYANIDNDTAGITLLEIAG